MKFGKYEARKYQIDAHEKSINHAKLSRGPAFLYMSVSAGKSLQMAIFAKHVADRFGRILILAHIGELVAQDAEACWDIGQPASIYCASLGIKDTQHPVIVGSEKSVYNAIDTDFSGLKFDLVLIDEAHRVPFDKPESVYMKLIERLRKSNENIKIFGYTGSPWRGTSSMLGEFWNEKLVNVDRKYLTSEGAVKPVKFGFSSLQYERNNFDATDIGDIDFSESQLAEIECNILEQPTKTQKIMTEVSEMMKSRNVCLITCAGQKHCTEAAKALEEGSYAVITEKTPTKERMRIKDACNKGDLKYVLQIGCWTVGVSIPRIDTIVILREIRSLVTLEQLIGRGVRLLSEKDIESGIVKNECLVLDYSSTMEVMASKFDNEELEEAEKSRAKARGEVQLCPVCSEENSIYARRCINKDHWWKFNECSSCGEKNDISSRVCSCCGEYLKDPNDKLGKAYEENDLIPVLKMDCKFDRGTLFISYYLSNGDVATETFWPLSRKRHCIDMIKNLASTQMTGSFDKRALITARNAAGVINAAKSLLTPKSITHRVNKNGKSVISRKIFN